MASLGRLVVTTLGLLVVVRRVTSVLISSSPIPLQKSEVHRQAEIPSSSRESGSHSDPGLTGSSILPSRILVGKHSRMTDLSLEDLLQE